MIYKRGGVFWIKYYYDGKPIFESSRSGMETAAKRLLKQREGEIVEGKMPGNYFDRVRFEELADDFVTDRKINKGEKSVADALKRLDPLKKMFAGMKVPRITTAKVKKYIQKRQADGMAAATINRELAALKRMFNLGAKETPPKVNRVPYIPMLRENNIRQGYFEHDAFLKLRDALPEHLKAYITFAYKSGWRWTEISGLTWKDVDLDRGSAWLDPERAKNNDGRAFYFDNELKTMIEALSKARRGNCRYVFQAKAKPIVEFRHAWNKACRDTGLGFGYRLSPEYVAKWQDKGLGAGPILHDLRRTAVRNLVRSGVPETVAMKISGHKTRSVFDRYNITSENDLRQASLAQENYLNKRAVQGQKKRAVFKVKDLVDQPSQHRALLDQIDEDALN